MTDADERPPDSRQGEHRAPSHASLGGRHSHDACAQPCTLHAVCYFSCITLSRVYAYCLAFICAARLGPRILGHGCAHTLGISDCHLHESSAPVRQHWSLATFITVLEARSSSTLRYVADSFLARCSRVCLNCLHKHCVCARYTRRLRRRFCGRRPCMCHSPTPR